MDKIGDGCWCKREGEDSHRTRLVPYEETGGQISKRSERNFPQGGSLCKTAGADHCRVQTLQYRDLQCKRPLIVSFAEISGVYI